VLRRPALSLDLGLDAFDPSVQGVNYRVQIGLEIPVFNWRRPNIEREEASASVAQLRRSAVHTRIESELSTAYMTFVAASTREQSYRDAVLPAATLAADATQESYALGRAPLFAVLEAQRSRVDAMISLVDARGARANAWVEVERLVGE
jgi:cobalt-zinc-cadmium efflux system outer membrane protein